jgi:hypothetical protein
MNATDIQQPPLAAAVARPVSPMARLAWLHLCSRRAPAALLALLACGVTLWASLRYHWWLGSGNATDELPMILQGCAAGIIAVTAHSPFGEPERAVGRRLAVLRAALVLALCGAAIGLFALGAMAAYSPRSGVYLAGGILPVARNILGMTGIGLAFCLVTGALTAWTGPLAFTVISQFALNGNYSWPLTWPARPPADRGGWIAALVVFAVGLAALAIRGPRIRQSDELPPAGPRNGAARRGVRGNPGALRGDRQSSENTCRNRGVSHVRPDPPAQRHDPLRGDHRRPGMLTIHNGLSQDGAAKEARLPNIRAWRPEDLASWWSAERSFRSVGARRSCWHDCRRGRSAGWVVILNPTGNP